MKKTLRSLAAVSALCLCVSASACGKKSVNVTENLEMKFNGYDGYATASLLNSTDWISNVVTTYGEGMDMTQLAMLEANLYDAVDFDIVPAEDISNGDEITVTVTVDNTKFEDQKFQLEGGTVTFTAEGLEEVETFDPFTGLNLTYEGFAPNGTAYISSSPDVNLSFSMDKNTGLSNGDTITVTAETYTGVSMEEFCAQYGKMPSVTEKTFTVEGLPAYASEIAEIPEEMMQKMDTQAQDVFKASVAREWDEPEGLQSITLLGHYFLKPKDINTELSPFNKIYLVYEVKATNSNIGEFTYFYYTRFDNIILLDDGTCSVDLSNYTTPGNSCVVGTYPGFIFENTLYADGYNDLDSLFSNCVTTQIDKYAYESTVK